MADFVAVIRRTVDGLTENVPERRAKVYEKARGAVRRQLENMKPQPTEDMINRQLAKLELAIEQVEEEHAEALPALDETPAAPVVEEPAAIAAEPERFSEPEPEPEPVSYEPEPVAYAPEPVPYAPEPVAHEPEPAVAEVPTYAAPVYETETPAAEVYTDPFGDVAQREETATDPVAYEEQAEDVHETQAVAAPLAEPEPVAEAPAERQDALWPEAEDSFPAREEPALPERLAPVYEAELLFERPTSGQDDPRLSLFPIAEPAPVEPADDDVFAHAFSEKKLPPKQVRVIEPDAFAPVEQASEWELPEWSDAKAAPRAAEPAETVSRAPIDVPVDDLLSGEYDVDPILATAAAVPPAAASADLVVDPGANAAEQPDWGWPLDPNVQQKEATTPDRGWDHIDELVAELPPARGVGSERLTARQATPASEEAAPAAVRTRSYRAEPRPARFTLRSLSIAAAAILLVGGGAYGYWIYREPVNGYIQTTLAGLMAPAPETTQPSTTETQTTNPATTPATTTETATGTEPAATTETEVAAVDPGITKFTQRLNADGTEIDAGPATVAGDGAVDEEGKSVSGQTETGQPVETALSNQATTPPVTPEETEAEVPATDPTTTPAVPTQVVPAGGQKMFLYEERLGQAAPTAIEGNAVWTLVEESPGGDAKPEPVIQAQISVPERGLTALMTIKRNADSSLPASHLIEIVFSLPPDFEGGSIDSVQRVAMKRTEQDRGDALIAVPAKITEDFHMIALNDFPEAVTNNVELLRSRAWIDIPLTYRNGRRALLTLEKGPEGTDAFTKAISAWSVLAPETPTAVQ